MQCPECRVPVPDDSRFCAACKKPVPGATGPSATTPSSDKWIVVIVLAVCAVILIGFVGIVAAIAIPNFLNAIDRGKQKRTMADLRSIATAFESYKIDHEAYPVATDIEELRACLEPTYIQALPGVDGWNHPLRVFSDGTSYELISPGEDGRFEGCGAGATTWFDADICLADGEFNQWPEEWGR